MYCNVITCKFSSILVTWLFQFTIQQSWGCYFENVIYYILLITVTYYCFGKVTNNILLYLLLYEIEILA